MVIHKLEICIEFELSVLMIAGSYYGSCSMQAMRGGRQEILSYASTAGTLQEGSYVGTWICEHLSARGVSLRVSLWDWRDFGKKGTISLSQSTHKCVSRYCKVSLWVVRHIAFHSLEPLSRRKSPSHKDSLHQHFCWFLKLNPI